MLENDFVGQLTKDNLEAHSLITGQVSICQSKTEERGTVLEPNTLTYSERVYGNLNLAVDPDGNSMSGIFDDPEKGTQNISLTRLSTPDTNKYYPYGIFTTTAPAKIYADHSTDSEVWFTVPAGTKLLFIDTILDDDGHPAWYVVAGGPEGDISKNIGAIQATNITCDEADPHPHGL